ncbi:MAG: hypothetical protein WAN66_14160 [Limnoraphis robusta]|uniref:Uncharacterized protein n=1 Tax=Limnoraphis robusta CS-951 TaxID=1637645 RepID=A0A0F5YJG0_9CYAN|nr:hypothetical protein [Limnoraphis robusta]KKD38787.1 hypothetical protein WN50_07005 [Limnoraphis robusta CS-951]
MFIVDIPPPVVVVVQPSQPTPITTPTTNHPVSRPTTTTTQPTPTVTPTPLTTPTTQDKGSMEKLEQRVLDRIRQKAGGN